MIRRLGFPLLEDPPPSTTVLGDWYANTLRLGSAQVVLCTSERSLLSVVVPARDLRSSLVPVLRDHVGALLLHIGVLPRLVQRELGEMQLVAFARTANKSVLGSMNDFAINLKYLAYNHPQLSLEDMTLQLCGTPCMPLRAAFPTEAAKALFEERPANNGVHLTRSAR